MACPSSADVVAVQAFSRVQLFVAPWTAACQASPSFTVSCSLLKFMSIESVTPSSRLILYCPLLLLPSVWFLHLKVTSRRASFKKPCPVNNGGSDYRWLLEDNRRLTIVLLFLHTWLHHCTSSILRTWCVQFIVLSSACGTWGKFNKSFFD